MARAELGARGSAALLPERVQSTVQFALQGATAVGINGDVWRRSGSSTWIRRARSPASTTTTVSASIRRGVPRWRAGDL